MPARLHAQRGDQTERPEVADLDLLGIQQVSKQDLRRSIATTETECRGLFWMPFCWVSNSPTFEDRAYLDREEFRRDVLRIRAFYWKRGYREASVDTAVTEIEPGRVRVTFDITEGPPTVISGLRVEYDSTLMSADRVADLSILRAGDPLNLVVLDSMRLHFLSALWELGYADAEVDTLIAVNAVERRAAVALRLRPNWRTTVGTITVRGNDQVSPATIQNAIVLRSGEPFRYSDLTQSQRNLYESNLFRLAMLTVPPRLDSIKDINIDVRESDMREAQLGAGVNNIDFVQTEGRFTHYNLLGGAQRFDVTAVLANLGAQGLNGTGIFRRVEQSQFFSDADAFLRPTWRFSAEFQQPALLGNPGNSAAIGGFMHRQAAPAVYVDRGYGAQASFTHSIDPRFRTSAAYRFEITRVEASEVYYCANYGVCDRATITALQRHQRLSPLQLSASIDRSDRAFSPTKGFVGRIDLEHASQLTVSDFAYNRAFAEAAVYTHFRYPSRDPRSQVLAARIRLGAVGALGEDQLHPRSRFYAGGSQSVRGYGENQLGPKILTIPSDALVPANIAAGNTACDTVSIPATRACDPNAAGLSPRDFTVRPVGGTSLLEASVEYRMPLGIGGPLSWAVFLDGAVVGGSALGSEADSLRLPSYSAALTPGIGIRYQSPVGPIRVDLGYNPRNAEALAVYTAIADAGQQRQLVRLGSTRTHVSGGTARGFWSIFNRLVLHLSIGQAY